MDGFAYWSALASIDGDVLAAVLRRLERPLWHAQAACRGSGPDAWFPTRNGDPGPGIAVCETCPVIGPCSEAGTREAHGTWAGVTAYRRKHRLPAA